MPNPRLSALVSSRILPSVPIWSNGGSQRATMRPRTFRAPIPTGIAASLDLCSVGEAWAMPPAGGGKALGDGVVMVIRTPGTPSTPEIYAPTPADNRVLWQRGRNFFGDNDTPADPLTAKVRDTVRRPRASSWQAPT